MTVDVCLSLGAAIAAVLIGARILVIVGRWMVLERIVRPGDWIRLGNAVGVVERIGAWSVALRTVEDGTALVPRRALVALHEEIVALNERCRVHATVSLLTSPALQAVEDARVELEQILWRLAPSAPGDLVARFRRDGSGQSLTLDVTAWLAVDDYRRFRVWRRELVVAISRCADRRRIRCFAG